MYRGSAAVKLVARLSSSAALLLQSCSLTSVVAHASTNRSLLAATSSKVRAKRRRRMTTNNEHGLSFTPVRLLNGAAPSGNGGSAGNNGNWGSPADACDKMLVTESSCVGDYATDGGAMTGKDALPGGMAQEPTVFAPKRVLILTKLTRYAFERRAHSGLSEGQLERELARRGSDFHHLKLKHQQHLSYLNVVTEELKANNIEYRVVHRWDYNEEGIEWADAIFSAGGDGTFLLAASKLRDQRKPLIGINTDFMGSEGYMCLIKKLPESHFHSAFQRLLNGDFHWLWRQRIRITLYGAENAVQHPVELHDQHLLYPEYRWADHVTEEAPHSRCWTQPRLRSSWRALAGRSWHSSANYDTSTTVVDGTTVHHCASSSSTSPISTSGATSDELATTTAALRQPRLHRHSAPGSCSPTTEQDSYCEGSDDEEGPTATVGKLLPFLALNEVFVGESLSSRVSYYELQVDDGELLKQKSSGLTVCTGTGSTSWYFNINKLTDQCVADLLRIVDDELNVDLSKADQRVMSKICKRFNDKLVFSPAVCRLAYTVRDPVYNSTFKPMPPRGLANRIRLLSRCFDAHLVIDGALSYVFNRGSEAVLEMRPEDALKTVVFRGQQLTGSAITVETVLEPSESMFPMYMWMVTMINPMMNGGVYLVKHAEMRTGFRALFTRKQMPPVLHLWRTAASTSQHQAHLFPISAVPTTTGNETGGGGFLMVLAEGRRRPSQILPVS